QSRRCSYPRSTLCPYTTLFRSRFDVPELVAEVKSELEPIIMRSKLAVTVDVPKDLPQLVSDRQKVKQIFLNLLSNALKFTHQGRITVSATRNGGGRTRGLSVAGTRIGLSPTAAAKILEHFRPIDSSRRRARRGA